MSQSITKLDAFTPSPWLSRFLSPHFVSLTTVIIQLLLHLSPLSPSPPSSPQPPRMLLLYLLFTPESSRSLHSRSALHAWGQLCCSLHTRHSVFSHFPSPLFYHDPISFVILVQHSNTPALATHRAQYLESTLSSLNCHASTKPFPMKSLISVSLSSK